MSSLRSYYKIAFACFVTLYYCPLEIFGQSIQSIPLLAAFHSPNGILERCFSVSGGEGVGEGCNFPFKPNIRFTWNFKYH